MKNFKDTVYSIFLNERKDIIRNKDGRIRMDPDTFDGVPTTPKQKLSIEATNARLDAADAQDAIDTKAFDDAKKTQGIKDATVVTSGGVKRSLTAAEAQQAANAAGVVSPHGNARPGEGLLTPEEQARINQVQQNPGDTTSRIVFQDKEQIDSNKIFNRTTGQWEQGPPRSKGRARPAGMPSGQHIDGMRDEEDTSIPYDPAKEQEGREASRKILIDIKKAAEAKRAAEATPELRRAAEDAQRAKDGMEPITTEDFVDKEQKQQKAANKAAHEKGFRESPAGMAAAFARGTAQRSKDPNVRRQGVEDYRVAMETAVTKATEDAMKAAAAPAATPAATPTPDQDEIEIEIQNNPTPRVEGSSENSALNRQNQENDRKRKGYINPNPTKDNPTDDSKPPQNFAPIEDIPRKREPKIGGKLKGENTGGVAISKGFNPPPKTEGYLMNKALTFFAEQLKRKYIEEEVVNPENQPMSKSEISHRDRIRHKSPAKDARIVKKSDKTQANAAYRLATYITMRGRKGKKKENK